MTLRGPLKQCNTLLCIYFQRNQSFASAPSSGSDRDSPPQPHGRRSSDSSYGDDQSIFKAAKVSSHLPISDYKDVPACVEEVTVVSSGGGNSSHHHDDFTEVPADMDTSFDERNFDDSFESNRAMCKCQYWARRSTNN